MLPYQINAHHNREPGFPGTRSAPPGWLLDRIANEKLTAGYSLRKNPVCPTCRVQKARNGSCNC
jgi:hypothetical protein